MAYLTQCKKSFYQSCLLFRSGYLHILLKCQEAAMYHSYASSSHHPPLSFTSPCSHWLASATKLRQQQACGSVQQCLDFSSFTLETKQSSANDVWVEVHNSHFQNVNMETGVPVLDLSPDCRRTSYWINRVNEEQEEVRPLLHTYGFCAVAVKSMFTQFHGCAWMDVQNPLNQLIKLTSWTHDCSSKSLNISEEDF